MSDEPDTMEPNTEEQLEYYRRRCAELEAENAELLTKVSGAIKVIKDCRFGGYKDGITWGPTPGVPDSYGYYLDGEYVGEIESLLLIVGKAS